MSDSFDQGADQALLSPAEQARAAAFAFATPRNRFIQCRAALRRLLAAHLGRTATEVDIDYGRHGKPELPNGSHLQFNVSHCENLAVLALTPVHRVGVDIERVRPLADMQSLADARFSPNEIAALASVEPEHKTHAFFTCWTRKEAFIKATGAGFSLPAHQFDVTLRPAEPPDLTALRGSGNRAADWALLDLVTVEGYAGAVAVENRAAELVIRGWLGDEPPDSS